jgi:galactokinase/mevalonate kinase-like predicted kinase
MSHISTPEKSKIIHEGIQSGASSGKLLGAGKFGFIMFLVHPKLSAISEKNLIKLEI